MSKYTLHNYDTSIKSARFYFVITLNHFSGVFRFDLCYDFSLWETETERCVPKEDPVFSAFPPLCNRTHLDCSNDIFPQYCPNTAEDVDSCIQLKPFFCKDSKTCISEGIVH